MGNKIKQNIDIPRWVKRSRTFSIACLRGLVDTDGCVFVHKYKVNGKTYGYKKLVFTSYSKPLLCSVSKVLKNIGLTPRLSGMRDIRIDSVENVKRYFDLVGTHNHKLLKKYSE